LRYYHWLVFRAPNIFNPYHNARHAYTVLISVHDGLDYNQYILPPDKRVLRGILISAILHDYGHSGKTGNDAREIQTAIKVLRSLILDSDRDLWPGIEELIGYSEFPYANFNVPLAAQILRDADRSQVFSETWLQQVVFGLAAESGRDPLDLLKQQIDFLNHLQFETDWAQQKFGPQITAKLAEVQAHLQIMAEYC
jgi:hypothetical protein